MRKSWRRMSARQLLWRCSKVHIWMAEKTQNSGFGAASSKSWGESDWGAVVRSKVDSSGLEAFKWDWIWTFHRLISSYHKRFKNLLQKLNSCRGTTLWQHKGKECVVLVGQLWDRTGRFLIKGSEFWFPTPALSVSRCPRAKHWTPNRSRCCSISVPLISQLPQLMIPISGRLNVSLLHFRKVILPSCWKRWRELVNLSLCFLHFFPDSYSHSLEPSPSMSWYS